MKVFWNRHNEYEQLLTSHIDGVLDAAGEAKLQQHLATCEVCGNEMVEQQAVRDLLRSQPMAEVPRSFALPYAPIEAPAPMPWILGGRATALLKGMQAATATTALVFVALIGASLVGVGGPAAGKVATLESAQDGALSRAAPEVSTDTFGLSADDSQLEAPTAEESAGAAFAIEAAPPPGNDDDQTIITQVMTDGFAAEPQASGESGGLTPTTTVGEAANDDATRSVLDWARIASGTVTVVFAATAFGLVFTRRRQSI